MDIKKCISAELVNTVYHDLSNKLDQKYHYHNLLHTKRVINSAIKIASHYQLSETDLRILLTSCLLHDYGFIYSHINHEEIAAEVAEKILPNYGFDHDQIKTIQNLILITKVEAKPNNLLESIIKDADLEYIGSNDFKNISENLKIEWIECGVVKNDSDFYDVQVKFLHAHKFYTNYMRLGSSDKKNKNIKYAEMMNKS